MKKTALLLASLVLTLGACVVSTTPAPVGPAGPPPPPAAGVRESDASLSGHITDAATGAPIGRAAVDIVIQGEGKYTQQTDASGNFAMTGVPPGEYRLRVRRDGYKPWQSELVTLHGGENAPLNVSLPKK
jgi:hypothetical protein